MPRSLPAALDRAVNRLAPTSGTAPTGARRVRLPVPSFRRILLGVDASRSTPLAVAWAAAVTRATGAEAWALSAAMPPYMGDHPAPDEARPPGPSGYETRTERAGRLLRRSEASFRRAGLRLTALAEAGPPAPALLRAAERVDADLVVLGSHGHGRLGRWFMGSVADTVLERGSASVLVARTRPPPRRILLTTDGSASSRLALAAGYRLARAWTSHATLFHAVPALGEPHVSERARRAVASLERMTRGAGPPMHARLAVGSPRGRILAEAKRQRAGLVVLGSTGLSGWRRVALGSVSRGVVHDAKASVLVVKGPGEGHGR